ncbi:MAG: DUF4332 domain-containing protein [Bacillota bacterium]|jgi:predicted flap endonuclease-1-like 5' DNA nuclease|nr:DUF4332 domain-containing protein [Bacillota bacterium]HOC06420.1 DUF4332 domain-containing protein [Bacillota bacterium]HPZ22294.1 DUF4332 domain-containing protein [Bacillota bacterium]HQD19934.1 DUF4332 domain-containing protein [Bacillota bacterium]
MTKLDIIEGIGPVYAEKLKEAGINSIEELLETGKTRKGRSDLAEKTGISGKLILTWVNHADLFRIKGLAGEYSELLEASGVNTVPQLATRVPENLLNKMKEVNEAKSLVRKLPSLSQVEGWIKEAGTLPRIVEY